jgi:hypothetical protein
MVKLGTKLVRPTPLSDSQLTMTANPLLDEFGYSILGILVGKFPAGHLVWLSGELGIRYLGYLWGSFQQASLAHSGRCRELAFPVTAPTGAVPPRPVAPMLFRRVQSLRCCLYSCVKCPTLFHLYIFRHIVPVVHNSRGEEIAPDLKPCIASNLGLLPAFADQKEFLDSGGIRTHALADWCLKPAP